MGSLGSGIFAGLASTLSNEKNVRGRKFWGKMGGKLIGKKIGSIAASTEGADKGSTQRTETEKVEGSLRKGGRINKTGNYRLHKGEKVRKASRSSKRNSRRSCR